MDIEENQKLENFGFIIARKRKLLKKTLQKLSDEIGPDEKGEKPFVSPSYLNRLESGERNSPSFQLVCIITKVMELDFREVIKSFGYEELLETSSKEYNENGEEYNKIEDIIRLSNILVGVNGKDVFLPQKEKETLIEIIYYIFGYGVSRAEELPVYIEKIVGKLIEFRRKRQGDSLLRVKVFGRELEIEYNRDINNKLEGLEINNEHLLNKIKGSIDENIKENEKELFIHDENLGVIMYCEIVRNTIRILSISNKMRSI